MPGIKRCIVAVYLHARLRTLKSVETALNWFQSLSF